MAKNIHIYGLWRLEIPDVSRKSSSVEFVPPSKAAAGLDIRYAERPIALKKTSSDTGVSQIQRGILSALIRKKGKMLSWDELSDEVCALFSIRFSQERLLDSSKTLFKELERCSSASGFERCQKCLVITDEGVSLTESPQAVQNLEKTFKAKVVPVTAYTGDVLRLSFEMSAGADGVKRNPAWLYDTRTIDGVDRVYFKDRLVELDDPDAMDLLTTLLGLGEGAISQQELVNDFGFSSVEGLNAVFFNLIMELENSKNDLPEAAAQIRDVQAALKQAAKEAAPVALVDFAEVLAA